MGKGFANAHDATTNMLAEIFEAVWGAVFIDSGFSYPRESPVTPFCLMQAQHAMAWPGISACMHGQHLTANCSCYSMRVREVYT